MPRKIKLTDRILEQLNPVPCPKCGNVREFIAYSSQFCEDCCNVWVECGKCSYDPTAENTLYRFEDVWGGTNDGNVIMAISCWNDAIKDHGKG